MGGNFIKQRLMCDPSTLANRFDGYAKCYATDKLGMGAVIPPALNKGGEVKSKLKTDEIMPDLRSQYLRVTRLDHCPRFEWKKWAAGTPDSNGVVLIGWPLTDTEPMALSKITTNKKMEAISKAIKMGECRLELAVDNAAPGKAVPKAGTRSHNTETAFDKFMNHHGGTLIKFGDEPDVSASKTRNSRKRKSESTSDSNPRPLSGEKENIPPPVGLEERQSKRLRPHARPVFSARRDTPESEDSASGSDLWLPSGGSTRIIASSATPPPSTPGSDASSLDTVPASPQAAAFELMQSFTDLNALPTPPVAPDATPEAATWQLLGNSFPSILPAAPSNAALLDTALLPTGDAPSLFPPPPAAPAAPSIGPSPPDAPSESDQLTTPGHGFASDATGGQDGPASSMRTPVHGGASLDDLPSNDFELGGTGSDLEKGTGDLEASEV
ncbi:hypothetical protein BC834DRAFT_904500 [Gloeopeniophorella convolvens]|nr:hypothetical protein BC834DRAFT_904500 [Gloeopeniophorella convolvens]